MMAALYASDRGIQATTALLTLSVTFISAAWDIVYCSQTMKTVSSLTPNTQMAYMTRKPLVANGALVVPPKLSLEALAASDECS